MTKGVSGVGRGRGAPVAIWGSVHKSKTAERRWRRRGRRRAPAPAPAFARSGRGAGRSKLVGAAAQQAGGAVKQTTVYVVTQRKKTCAPSRLRTGLRVRGAPRREIKAEGASRSQRCKEGRRAAAGGGGRGGSGPTGPPAAAPRASDLAHKGVRSLCKITKTTLSQVTGITSDSDHSPALAPMLRANLMNTWGGRGSGSSGAGSVSSSPPGTWRM